MKRQKEEGPYFIKEKMGHECEGTSTLEKGKGKIFTLYLRKNVCNTFIIRTIIRKSILSF